MKMNGWRLAAQRHAGSRRALALAAVEVEVVVRASSSRSASPSSGDRRSNIRRVFSTNPVMSSWSNGRSGGRFFGIDRRVPRPQLRAGPGPCAARSSSSSIGGTTRARERVGELQADRRACSRTACTPSRCTRGSRDGPRCVAIRSRQREQLVEDVRRSPRDPGSRRSATSRQLSCARRAVGLLEVTRRSAGACTPCPGSPPSSRRRSCRTR